MKTSDKCWYIGDNYKADYEGAKAAGFRSVWLNRLQRQEPCGNQCRGLEDFVLQVLQA